MNPPNAIIPVPKCAVTIREAVLSDLKFIDALQKTHRNQVGFLMEKALVAKINAKQVIVASEQLPVASENNSLLATGNSQLATPVGYCIGQDQYFKRDDVGIIYQMNIAPAKQRGLIGATLVKAMFERASYACRLFCCWCAQDLDANYFWESLGFVPLAFRAGSRAKSRVHIFWQKRVREGDTTTNWWLPTQTSGGAMGEDRIVLPIPPGTHWSDAKPLILPGGDEPKKLPAPRAKKPKPVVIVNPHAISNGGLRFPNPNDPLAVVKAEPKEKPKRVKAKNDPAIVAKVRELNARWMEQVNGEGGSSLLLPVGKYEVSRQLAAPTAEAKASPMLLEQAA